MATSCWLTESCLPAASPHPLPGPQVLPSLPSEHLLEDGSWPKSLSSLICSQGIRRAHRGSPWSVVPIMHRCTFCDIPTGTIHCHCSCSLSSQACSPSLTSACPSFSLPWKSPQEFASVENVFHCLAPVLVARLIAHSTSTSVGFPTAIMQVSPSTYC